MAEKFDQQIIRLALDAGKPMGNGIAMAPRTTHLIGFATRVLRDFFLRNNGLLLTSAVAYNALLSLVPLTSVMLVFFSQFYEEELIIDAIMTEVALIAPGATGLLADVLTAFMASRELAGWIGILVLLFFGSLAFRVLQNAMAIIFHRPLPTLKRKFWVSALIPYLFIGLVAAGLIVVTALTAVIESPRGRVLAFGSFNVHYSSVAAVVLHVVGWLGLVLLFTTLYKVMPAAKVSFRLALAGGLTAAVLWEGLRFLLTGYFANISMVNAVYGSMATTIIVLLTMEAVALIVLIGAQVIADLQRSMLSGAPWWEDPEEG